MNIGKSKFVVQRLEGRMKHSDCFSLVETTNRRETEAQDEIKKKFFFGKGTKGKLTSFLLQLGALKESMIVFLDCTSSIIELSWFSFIA